MRASFTTPNRTRGDETDTTRRRRPPAPSSFVGRSCLVRRVDPRVPDVQVLRRPNAERPHLLQRRLHVGWEVLTFTFASFCFVGEVEEECLKPVDVKSRVEAP